MRGESVASPDSTAVRVAFWRALHLEVDAPPAVFRDEVGPRLVGPETGWRERPDMAPFTRFFRAAIVAQRYFANRTDGLRPPDPAEELLVATT
nr:class I SAM-dependent methyltransferase [Geothrix sp. SG200]